MEELEQERRLDHFTFQGSSLVLCRSKETSEDMIAVFNVSIDIDCYIMYHDYRGLGGMLSAEN